MAFASPDLSCLSRRPDLMRLHAALTSVRESTKAIQDISALPLDKAETYFRTLKLEGASLDIGKKLIDEILFRLKF